MSRTLQQMTVVLFAVTLGLLAACGQSPALQTVEGHAQGTTYSVQFWSKDSQSIDEIKQAVDAELSRIDKLMSNWREDSNVELFNAQEFADTPIALDTEVIALLKAANTVHDASEQCFDPTISPIFKIWGFKDGSLSIPNQTEIDKALSAVGFSELIIATSTVSKSHAQQKINLAAIGQGYAVSQIAMVLQQHGIENYLVEIGGEMLLGGSKPDKSSWRVGVERPTPDSQKVNEVIKVTGESPVAIMTSGTYRHYFDDNGTRYSHILDPRTGRPVEHNGVSVTVLMRDATLADAWSTALLCLGPEAGMKVANEHNIAAIFYNIHNGELSRTLSKVATKDNAAWEISPR